MAEGLLSQAGQVTAAEPPQGAETSMLAEEEVSEEMAPGQEEATSEEQEAYDSALNMAGELLHGNDDSSSSFLGILADKEAPPEENIATVTGHIMGKIEETFQGEFPETMVIPAANEISELVMELGESGGAFDLDDTQIMNAKAAVIRDLMETYGVDEADYQEFMAGVSPEDQQALQGAFGGGA